MEKKIWAKPEMNEIAFAANEYVATNCNGKPQKYLFDCNAWIQGLWDRLYYYKDLLVKPGSQTPTDGWENHQAEAAGNMWALQHQSENLQADVGSDFYYGFIDNGLDGIRPGNNAHDENETVIVWFDGDKAHATTNLDMSTWEVNKS